MQCHGTYTMAEERPLTAKRVRPSREEIVQEFHPLYTLFRIE